MKLFGHGFAALVLAGLSAHAAGAWERVTDGNVTSITVAPNGAIYGIGTEGSVYRTREHGVWEKVSVPYVTSVAVTGTEEIYGVGGDGTVYETRPFENVWHRLSMDPVMSIAVAPTGQLYVVFQDQSVYSFQAPVMRPAPLPAPLPPRRVPVPVPPLRRAPPRPAPVRVSMICKVRFDGILLSGKSWDSGAFVVTQGDPSAQAVIGQKRYQVIQKCRDGMRDFLAGTQVNSCDDAAVCSQL